MKPEKITRQEWERQSALPILERTHIADEDFCIGTGLDIRAAGRLQADGAFRSAKTSTAEGSLRVWSWDATFRAAACWAIHEFFGLTYSTTADVAKNLPPDLWAKITPSEEEVRAFGGTLSTEADNHHSAMPEDWFLLLAGRRVILVSGAGLASTTLNPIPGAGQPVPVALLGELTPEGYRDLSREAKLGRAADKKAGAIDLNRANANVAEQSLDNAEALVRINLSLGFRRCMARAAKLDMSEIWGSPR